MQRKEGPAVTATITYVGVDVHARSTHAAAIGVLSGELRRARFGAGAEPVIGWLQGLPQPVRACYEAGPTGFALYRRCRPPACASRSSRRARPRARPAIGSRACECRK